MPRPICRVTIFCPIQAEETGFDPGAEGATAPETLRQKDRWIETLWRAVPLKALTEGGKSDRKFRPGEISQVV